MYKEETPHPLYTYITFDLNAKNHFLIPFNKKKNFFLINIFQKSVVERNVIYIF